MNLPLVTRGAEVAAAGLALDLLVPMVRSPLLLRPF
jgi:hypothetical protein